jgi:hypothetical protein
MTITRNNYNEEFEEFEDFYEEFEAYTFIERKTLFIDLISRMENLSDKENQKLVELTEFVFNENIEKDETKKYVDFFEQELDLTFLPMEELPFEIWGVEPGTLTVTKEMERLFLDCYQSILSQPKKAEEKLKKLNNLVGNIPATALLELMTVQAKIEDDPDKMQGEYTTLVKKMYAQFPDYPLIKILYINRMGDPELKKFIAGPRVSYFFKDRTKWHEIEALNYILLLLTDASFKQDNNKLWALECYLLKSDLTGTLRDALNDVFSMSKRRAVAEYFMKTKE